MKRKNKKNIKIKFNFNILLLILIPTALICVSVAKYIQEKNMEILYEAKKFYFESDLLYDSNENENYEIIGDTVSFYLKNNGDSLRYSEVDIEYIVTITDTQGNEVENKNGESVSQKEGILLKNNINLEEIQFTDLLSGTYIVTAKAVEPYEKTLSATFVLSEEEENIEYEVTDSENSPIVEVTVSTQIIREILK